MHTSSPAVAGGGQHPGVIATQTGWWCWLTGCSKPESAAACLRRSKEKNNKQTELIFSPSQLCSHLRVESVRLRSQPGTPQSRISFPTRRASTRKTYTGCNMEQTPSALSAQVSPECFLEPWKSSSGGFFWLMGNLQHTFQHKSSRLGDCQVSAYTCLLLRAKEEGSKLFLMVFGQQ